MPIVKIFTTAPLPEDSEGFARTIETACVQTLQASVDAVEIVLVKAAAILRGPQVLVEVHFRATAHRDASILSAFMETVDRTCEQHLGHRPRIRCFSIDQATLHASC